MCVVQHPSSVICVILAQFFVFSFSFCSLHLFCFFCCLLLFRLWCIAAAAAAVSDLIEPAAAAAAAALPNSLRLSGILDTDIYTCELCCRLAFRQTNLISPSLPNTAELGTLITSTGGRGGRGVGGVALWEQEMLCVTYYYYANNSNNNNYDNTLHSTTSLITTTRSVIDCTQLQLQLGWTLLYFHTQHFSALALPSLVCWAFLLFLFLSLWSGWKRDFLNLLDNFSVWLVVVAVVDVVVVVVVVQSNLWI